MKAQQAFRDANSGMPPNVPNDIFKPSQIDDQKDELSIFSGKTHTVSTVSTPITLTAGRSSQPTTSRGDSPQQILTENPSFVNVHPSLISELSSFQPFIREQVQNAYRIGGDVFGGAPIIIDPIRRIPAGQMNPLAQSQLSLSVVAQKRSQQQQFQQQQQHQREQEQQQQLAAFHQQELERERFEQERRDLERREIEIQELERQQYEQQEIQRQEMEKQRQQMLEYQQLQVEQEEMRRLQEIRLQELRRQQEAEQEAIRRHEAQEERRRQQEQAQQMQRQDQYRQLEIQQRHFEQQRHMVQYQQQHEASVSKQPTYMSGTSDLHDVASNSMYSLHNRVLHSQSTSSLRQAYQQQYRHQMPVSQSTGQITSQQTGMSGQPITPQHTGSQPQRALYTVRVAQSSDSMDTTIGYIQTTTSYGQSHTSSSAMPAPHSLPDAYKYWPAASTSFAIPHEPPGAASIGEFAMQTPLQPQPRYQHQQYTPEGALKGIAADDRSLQETWQSYMSKVWSIVFCLKCLVAEVRPFK